MSTHSSRQYVALDTPPRSVAKLEHLCEQDGRRPLHLAVMKNHEPVFRYLSNAEGIDLDADDLVS